MTTTIQQTAKRYKLGIALGMFMLIMSLLVAAFMHLVEEPAIRNGALISAAAWYGIVVMSKLGAWWNHG